MKTYFKTKHGTEIVHTDGLMNPDGAVYRSLVDYFNDFINHPGNSEAQSMYFEQAEELGGGSYLCWRSAVKECYYALMEHLEENNIKNATSKIFYQVDFDGILQA